MARGVGDRRRANIGMKFSKAGFVKGAVQVYAPKTLSILIGDMVKNHTTADVYKFFNEGSLRDKLSPNVSKFLLNYKPWDLSWFSVEWIIDAIAKYNINVAYLIGTSPELQDKLKGWIKEMKEWLE